MRRRRRRRWWYAGGYFSSPFSGNPVRLRRVLKGNSTSTRSSSVRNVLTVLPTTNCLRATGCCVIVCCLFCVIRLHHHHHPHHHHTHARLFALVVCHRHRRRYLAAAAMVGAWVEHLVVRTSGCPQAESVGLASDHLYCQRYHPHDLQHPTAPSPSVRLHPRTRSTHIHTHLRDCGDERMDASMLPYI